MRKGQEFLLLIVLLIASVVLAGPPEQKILLVVHGGAGTITRENMTPEKEKAIRDELSAALDAGYAVLKEGGAALDAVEASVVFMENSPWFNAGKGAVFTHDGTNEMDAAIMDGSTRRAGAVAAVTTIKNPIRAARAVMEKTPHVMLVGAGADTFAKSAGLDIVDPSYFRTEQRYKQLQEELRKEREKSLGHGTVGAVALDVHGNVAAATSTGGLTNKLPGRVGDTPIIGAGTYADNNTCAVSGTGWGEYFMRGLAAYDIAALKQYKGLSLKEAAEEVILHKLAPEGGTGGVIALDREGDFVMTFSTEGMYRGYVGDDGVKKVLIYGDDAEPPKSK
jgi:beta-aspartyl-peptidase (threonine type)